MNKIRIVITALSAWFLVSAGVWAQTTVIGGGQLQLGQDQLLMFQAAQKVINHDYKGAEDLYNQAIEINNKNIDAYMQRGIVRRELGDTGGTLSDGKMTANLANAALAGNPRDPNLYYKRGMGFRLVKDYNQAEQDITTGMKLGGPSSWKTDLQAIQLEKKENNVR